MAESTASPTPATPPVTDVAAQAATTDQKVAAEASVNSGRRDPQGRLIDATGRLIDETGAHGMSLMSPGERAGSNIADELVPEPPSATAVDPYRFQRRYLGSRLAKEAGSVIGRPPDAIGFFGKGDTIRGTHILVNVDTLEKVRVYDGWKFEGDEVFANSRDLPTVLVEGDVAKSLGGK